MEFTTRIANVKPSTPAINVEKRVIDTLRATNARLQQQMRMASKASDDAQAEAALTRAQMAQVTADLAAARKTIAELEAKVKEVSEAMTSRKGKTRKAEDIKSEGND